MALSRLARPLLLPLLLLALLAGCGGQASAPPATAEQQGVDRVASNARATLDAALTEPATQFGGPANPPGTLTAADPALTGVAPATPAEQYAPAETAAETLVGTPAEAPTDTPTPVPPDTPTATASATPQPSPTPTPDAGATQTGQAQQVAAAVGATLAAQAAAQALATAMAATLAALAPPPPSPTRSPTPAPEPPPAPLTASPARLAFVFGDVGAADIWVHDPAAARTWAVAERACDEAEPDWAPDGRSVVYQSDCDGNYDLYLADVETRSVRQLTASAEQDEREPDISPDGKWVVYRANAEGDARNADGSLWVRNLGGGDPQPLGVSGRSPVWSPNGAQVLYMSERESNWEVYVFTLADRSTSRLTYCSPNCRFPAWSADGRWVIYHSTTGADTADAETIWRVAADGGEPILVVTGDGAGRPTWSAAGWIAFNSQAGIEMVDEGGQQRRTLLVSNSHWAPAWSR